MARAKQFKCIRPSKEKASKIAALPYDVYNRAEAKAEIEKNPDSFLKIDRAETQFDDSVGTYDDCVYQKAHDLLWEMVANGDFVKEKNDFYYLYELTMNGHTQTGIVTCISIDDFENGIVKKHENTRADKEQDRIRHVDTCNAQTGPVFLTYPKNGGLDFRVELVKNCKELYDFVSDDGVRHKVWSMENIPDIAITERLLEGIKHLYIADGHHRASAAVKTGLKRREENPRYTGEEEFNYVLCVLFPDDQLEIMGYHRVVKDLNGMTSAEFLNKMKELFDVYILETDAKEPEQKGIFNMYLDGCWYVCKITDKDLSDDPVKGLDVAILQDKLLAPVLGIKDPKTDDRIDFVGGIRGPEELERRCNEDCKVAFAMYPTDIKELMAVSDANALMPPKSTWFEPKLRSGLFIHEI